MNLKIKISFRVKMVRIEKSGENYMIFNYNKSIYTDGKSKEFLKVEKLNKDEYMISFDNYIIKATIYNNKLHVHLIKNGGTFYSNVYSCPYDEETRRFFNSF